MKIAIVLGTRPEIIKMASVMDEIERRGHELLLIHTGQHYDKEMSENFFIDLKLPTPNYNIHVGSGSHGKQTGNMMEGIEEVLLDEKPDILLVQGDTNAVLAGALVASKLHIPVGHVEAGLRSFDETMPEEINRLAADICSKLYFVPNLMRQCLKKSTDWLQTYAPNCTLFQQKSQLSTLQWRESQEKESS